jgi:hypothetical protein
MRERERPKEIRVPVIFISARAPDFVSSSSAEGNVPFILYLLHQRLHIASFFNCCRCQQNNLRDQKDARKARFVSDRTTLYKFKRGGLTRNNMAYLMGLSVDFASRVRKLRYV